MSCLRLAFRSCAILDPSIDIGTIDGAGVQGQACGGLTVPAARRRNRIKPHRLPTRSSLSHILHCCREGHGKLHRCGCCLRCNGRRHLVQGSAALPVPTAAIAAAAAASFAFHEAFGGQLWFCELRRQGVQCSQHNTRFTICTARGCLDTTLHLHPSGEIEFTSSFSYLSFSTTINTLSWKSRPGRSDLRICGRKPVRCTSDAD